MTSPVISVENLGKKYRITHHNERRRYRRLSEELWNAAKAPFKLFDKSASRTGSGLRTASSYSEDFWALRDVSFEVNEGDVVGIIGRNGAGKSTLLKILSQITEPTTGRVRIKGRVASLLEVGTGFHPELTGRENIFLNGAILGMTRAEIKRKFDEIVAFAEVEQFLDTPVKRYSSGMYVRLAFAVAAHLDPEILVVDEVLAVGDAAFQKKCLGKMQDVSKGGRTVLFVSHNMSAIQSLCAHGVFLKSGRLDTLGATSSVIARYISQSAAVASGKVEFDDRTLERFGPKELAVLKSLCLLDADKQFLQVVKMGQSITIRLEIEFKNPGNSFEIGVSVGNMLGVELHYLISNWEGLEAIETAGLKTIEVTVPSLNLFPGSYQLSVWVKQQGGAYDDAVHEAIQFEVVEGAMTPHFAYFTRYSLNSQVYVPSRWQLR